jgi:hypothetical protein
MEASLPLTVLYPEVPRLDLLHFAADALQQIPTVKQSKEKGGGTLRSGLTFSQE